MAYEMSSGMLLADAIVRGIILTVWIFVVTSMVVYIYRKQKKWRAERRMWDELSGHR